MSHRTENSVSDSRAKSDWTGRLMWLAGAALIAGGLFLLLAPQGDAAPQATDAPAIPVQQVASQSEVPAATQSIESIRVGQRVPAKNPTDEFDSSLGTEVDPATWRHLVLRMTKQDGGKLDMELLRPLGWVLAHQAVVGGTIDLDLPELGAKGEAQVVSLGPCPEIAKGDGRVVIGTFAHEAAKTFDLRIEGEDRSLGVTPEHPFWSEDRQRFIAAEKLTTNERVRTIGGDSVRVISLLPRPGPERVYNIEVHGEHVYHVGTAGVLVHNQCARAAAPSKVRGGLLPHLEGNIPDAAKWIRNGGRAIHHTDGSITYIKDGMRVVYNSKGYPNFSRYLYNGTDGLSQVPIQLTGTRAGDFAAANRAAGLTRTPRGYTWHHNEDVGLMQLVRTRVHSQFWHSGGFSLGR